MDAFDVDQVLFQYARAAKELWKFCNLSDPEFVARLIRDSAIVDAHRSGLSSREISELVGDMGQPNVVRARRRAVTRRETVPDDLLSPADALRASGLSAKVFIDHVRQRNLHPVELAGGVRAFRPEDIERLRTPDPCSTGLR